MVRVASGSLTRTDRDVASCINLERWHVGTWPVVPPQQYLWATHVCAYAPGASVATLEGMKSSSICPSCASPILDTAAFCPRCDALVHPATDPQALATPAPRPSVRSVQRDGPLLEAASVRPEPVRSEPRHAEDRDSSLPGGLIESGVVSAPRVDCWDCGTPTPIDRDFCRHCGVWLQTSPTTSAQEERPSNAFGSAPLALTAGSFGPRPLSIERRSIGNRAVLGAGATLLMAGIVGIAAVYTAMMPHSADDLTAAQVPTPSEAAASTGKALDVDEASIGSAEDDASRALVAAAIEVPPEEAPTIDEAIEVDVDATPSVEATGAEPREAQPRTPESALATAVSPAVATTRPAVDTLDSAQPAEADTPTVEPSLASSPAETTKPAQTTRPSVIAPPSESPIDPSVPQPDSAPRDSMSEEAARAPAADRTAAATVSETRVDGNDEPPGAIWRNGWVCDGSLDVADPTGQRWSVVRVSFVPRSGFERVALTMKPAGPDKGSPASVTAETYDNATLRERFPNVAAPAGGRNAILLNLTDGVWSPLDLRGYRPRGLETLKEFSVFQSPNGSSKLVVGVAGEGCFRLRVPVWNRDGSSGVRQIQLDVKS